MTKQNLEPRCLVDGANGWRTGERFFVLYDIRSWVPPATDDELENKWHLSSLTNAEDEFHDDAWDWFLQRAKHTDENGVEWTLYQDGDVFAIPDGFNMDEWLG